ncbi:hypothetical protein ACFXG4_27150 [Nocardia sp. NPDC059246]|uniref:hypothetical protein n=1 Tax=unclassified Nocardia TaxID=2637762 RepID=UPI00369A13A4
MEHNVPVPNPFITEWLKGPICEGMMLAAGMHAKDLYQQIEVKRTGEMAASATVDVHIGGVKGDRFVADMIVTDRAAASHIFGAGMHAGSTGLHHNRAARTLDEVLRGLAAP